MDDSVVEEMDAPWPEPGLRAVTETKERMKTSSPPARVSMIRLIHSIGTGLIGLSLSVTEPANEVAIATCEL